MFADLGGGGLLCYDHVPECFVLADLTFPDELLKLFPARVFLLCGRTHVNSLFAVSLGAQSDGHS